MAPLIAARLVAVTALAPEVGKPNNVNSASVKGEGLPAAVAMTLLTTVAKALISAMVSMAVVARSAITSFNKPSAAVLVAAKPMLAPMRAYFAAVGFTLGVASEVAPLASARIRT